MAIFIGCAKQLEWQGILQLSSPSFNSHIDFLLPIPPSPLPHELLLPGLKHSVVFFRRYLCYWKARFKEKPITEFCPVIKINSKPDGRLLSKKVSSDINASGIMHFFIYMCMYVIASCTSHPRDSSLQVCNHFHSCEKDGHKS